MKVGPDHPPDLKAIADRIPPLKEKAEAVQGATPVASSSTANSKAADPKQKSKSTPAPVHTKTAQLDSVPECADSIIKQVCLPKQAISE